MMPSSSYSSSSNDMVGWRHVPALHKQCSEWPRTTYIYRGCLAGLYRNQLLGNASRISVYTHVYTYVSSSTSSSSALWLTHARRDIQIYICIYIDLNTPHAHSWHATALGSTTVCNMAGPWHKIQGHLPSNSAGETLAPTPVGFQF